MMPPLEQIEQALRLFAVPGQVIELRALRHSPAKRVECESFADITKAAERAWVWDNNGWPEGIYFTPNPLKPDMAGRTASARKEDISARHWLLVDVDPVRPDKCSSTEPELQEAWEVIDACRSVLKGAGCVGEIVGCSGNGWHLCYPIDLPNNDESQALVKAVLVGLGKHCDTDRAKVDVKCFDAVRIWKLYGTMVRKGPDQIKETVSPDGSEIFPPRPHRRAFLVEGSQWQAQRAHHNNEALRLLLERWRYADDQRKGRPVGDVVNRAKDYIAKMPPAISGKPAAPHEGNEKHGHDQTFAVACVLVKDFALTEEQALQAIQEWNSRCQPPWKESELRHKFRSAAKKEGPTGKLLKEQNGHTSNGHALPQTPVKAEEPEQWERPIPLNSAPAVEPFPLDVFPPAIGMYVQKLAWATNAPVDFAAVPLLVCASGAIGNTRRLAITRAHQQPACIFACIIGRPVSLKSTPLHAITYPLHLAEHHYYQEWKKDLEEWENEEPAEGEVKRPKPRLRRALLDDTTVEAMVRILGDNPRGLLMSRDELAALITGMNQYKDNGKGNDRQNWLKIWSGKRIEVDRKSFEGVPLVVNRPFVSAIGGIQPQVIECMRGEQQGDRPPPDDGFLDRFALCFPDPLPAVGETWRDVTEEESAVWAETVQRLLNLTMLRIDGDHVPDLMPFTDTARIAWTRLTQEHADEVNNDLADWLWGPWAKMVPGYAGRFALTLQLIWNPEAKAVDGPMVELAFKLVSYFKSHARKVYSFMSADPRIAEAQHVLNWLSRNPKVSVFSRSDAYVDLRRTFNKPEALERPLKFLCEHRFLRPTPEPARSGAGRKPTPRYEVSPLWRQEIQTIQTI